MNGKNNKKISIKYPISQQHQKMMINPQPINQHPQTYEFSIRSEVKNTLNCDYSIPCGGMQDPLFGLDKSIIFHLFEDGFMAFDYETKQSFRFFYPLGVAELMLYNKLLSKFYQIRMQEMCLKNQFYEQKYIGLLNFIRDIAVNKHGNYVNTMMLCKNIIKQETNIDIETPVEYILHNLPFTNFATANNGVLDANKFINPFSEEEDKKYKSKVELFFNEEETNTSNSVNIKKVEEVEGESLDSEGVKSSFRAEEEVKTAEEVKAQSLDSKGVQSSFRAVEEVKTVNTVEEEVNAQSLVETVKIIKKGRNIIYDDRIKRINNEIYDILTCIKFDNLKNSADDKTFRRFRIVNNYFNERINIDNSSIYNNDEIYYLVYSEYKKRIINENYFNINSNQIVNNIDMTNFPILTKLKQRFISNMRDKTEPMIELINDRMNKNMVSENLPKIVFNISNINIIDINSYFKSIYDYFKNNQNIYYDVESNIKLSLYQNNSKNHHLLSEIMINKNKGNNADLILIIY